MGFALVFFVGSCPGCLVSRHRAPAHRIKSVGHCMRINRTKPYHKEVFERSSSCCLMFSEYPEFTIPIQSGAPDEDSVADPSVGLEGL